MVRTIKPKIHCHKDGVVQIIVSFYFVGFRFLFDWKSPLGYLSTVFLQYILIAYANTFLASEISFAGGAALFMIAVTKDIHAILRSINNGAKNNRKRLHISRQLIRFVKLHSDLKQLSRIEINCFFNIFQYIDIMIFRPVNYLMELFEPGLMIMFAWSIITVSGAMLMIRIEMVSICLLAAIKHVSIDSYIKQHFSNCNCLPIEITWIE